MPKVEINGVVVEFDTMPSPEDIDFAAAQMPASSPRPPALTPPLDDPVAKASAARPIAQGVGAMTGLVTGIPGGPGTMATGAFAGANLGGTAYDIAQGDVDPYRLATGVAADAALRMTPAGQGLSLGREVARSSAVQTLAGQAYDAARAYWTGESLDPTTQAARAAGDVVGSAVGVGIGRGQRAIHRRSAAGQRIDANRAQFGQYGVEPLASEQLAGAAPGRAGLAAQIEQRSAAFPVGGGGPRRTAARREGQIQQAARERIDPISSMGLSSQEQGGLALQPHVQAALDASRTKINEAFTAVNAITGNEPVVPTKHFRDALTLVGWVGQRKPIGAPGFTRKMQDATTPRTVYEVTGSETVQPPPPRRPTPSDRPQIATQAVQPEGYVEGEIVDGPIEQLIAEAMTRDTIPLWQARRIESELGNIGWRGSPPIGGVAQADTRLLYRAVMKDFDEFFATGIGQTVRPELQAAKALYKQERHTFNDTLARQFLEDSSVTPEAMFRMALTGDASNARLIKGMVPDEVWDGVAQGYMEGLYRQATMEVGPDRQVKLSPAKLASAIRKADGPDGTKLDVILGPTRAAEWRDFAAMLRSVRESSLPGFNPSGTSTGQVGYQQIIGVPAAAGTAAMTGQPALSATLLASGFGLPMAAGRLARPQTLMSVLDPSGRLPASVIQAGTGGVRAEIEEAVRRLFAPPPTMTPATRNP